MGSAPTVADDVVDDVEPIQKPMQDRPADGLPLDVGDHHGQHCAEGYTFAHGLSHLLGGIVVMHHRQLSFLSVDQLLYGYVQDGCDLM